MPHRIGRHEAVGAALLRLLGEDVDRARADLSAEGDVEARVHRARQRLKRARSLLIVLKPALGASARRLKRDLAGTARLLAGARDADAAAQSARGIHAAVGENAGFDRIVAELDREARRAHQRTTPIEEAIGRLASAAEDIAALESGIDGERLLAHAVGRVYRAGRKSFRRARSSMATPDLHRWRKDVKDLWHLMRLGRRRLPASAGRLAGRLERLAGVLGLDHDHAILAEKLALSPHADHDLKRQLSIIARERRRLEAEAFALGEETHGRKPKDFARRMRLD